MDIAAETLTPEQAYRLLVGIVVPRPIAWVVTQSPGGRANVAPFSCFTFVCYAPPMVAISVGRRGNELKDTARNIMDRGEFVVNVADETFLDALHRSSIEFPSDVSEVEELGLDIAPSHSTACPRLAGAPVALECKLHQTVEFGSLQTQLIVGEVVHFQIRDGLCRNGKIETDRLRPLGRVAGPRYVKLREFVSMTPTGDTFG
jgi:flavin reductase (DIM6/NTAB) family NADH-FMN oxidoreductase RutF